MKIAMIGHKVVPSREGGIEIVVEELATRMTAAGHEVTLYNRKRKRAKGERKRTEFAGCRVEEVFTVDKRSLDAIVYAFFATLKARRLARKGKLDVLHYHAEGPCFFLGLLPKKKRKFKLVVTIHGLDWQRGKWGGFATKILKKGERNAVKYADEIIVLSENNRKYFKETYNRETVFIPNGVREPECLPAEIIRDKWGLERDSYVLFLARIVPEKGLHYLVNAWKRLVERGVTDKKLVIAGGASHSAEYYEGIAKSCEGDPSVLMTGFVEGKTLKELYSGAYLYVLPSDLEGMPMSFLEALSYGNICLVSDIEENAEVAAAANENGRCAYTFKHGDEADLEAKIEALLKAELKTHVAPVLPFRWEDVTERTIEVYKRKDC
ncbi:MAG: glycosyltransferase family 4 protein [Clostridia bacterium]|nr:glycosyltransferase family 4 protein [Clostridia bacterium]